MTAPAAGWLFAYDWDREALDRLAAAGTARFDHAGFDLFAFPSNAALIGFDLERFARRQAERGRRAGWRAVLSHHEQFGALAAALVAERLGLPGPRPEAILAAQHKLHARRVLEQVAPEANLGFAELPVDYGGTIPDGLAYPSFVKPVKAAFSVLAREVDGRAALQAHTRFGRRELWVIRRLVEPFERVCRARLPQAGSAHRLLLEEPVPAAVPQFNLDGWVDADGRAHPLAVVDAVMVPGTQAFMRWEVPSRLDPTVQRRALDVAQRFLAAIGLRRCCFNLEFFHDAASGRLSVIECNPRLASQFADLHRRVLGVDAHAMGLALALGEDPLAVPRRAPSDGAAASLVYRTFAGEPVPTAPDAAQRAALARAHPDALLLAFPKRGHALARDYKWTGSHRYGIVHLGGRDREHLRERAEHASALLGWPAPYLDRAPAPVVACTIARAPSDTSLPRTMPTLPRRLLDSAALAVLAIAVLSGCSAWVAQNPQGALRPVNAVAVGEDRRVMLGGADVVAYFTEGRHVQGSPEFESVHEGVTFRFASAAHKARFDAAPAAHLPQYGGYCTNGIAYGIPWGGDADTWRMIDGKLYIFGGRASLEAFELDVPGNLQLAERYWRDEVAGSNSFLQRAKRLVLRVPHYKSGEELAALVAAAKAQQR